MSQEIEKPNYYSITPASVRYNKKLKPLARLLYGEITALCNEKGFCWAKNSYFAGLYEVDERSVTRWIKDLEKGEYIRVKMEYKENSKEIKRRLIYISDPLILHNLKSGGDKNVTTPPDTGVTPPPDKNVTTPGDNNVKVGGDKNVGDNNKLFNDNNSFFSNSKTASKIDLENYGKEKKYLSDFEEFWIKNEAKGWKGIENRYAQYDGWELEHKKKYPEKHKITLNSANSESTVAQSDPIKINNDDPLWLKLLEVMKSDFEKDVYEKWLSKLNFIHLKDGDMLLGTESKFLRDWIKREHLTKIKSSFQQAEESLKSINIIYV